jgi:hypothetical protein
MRRSLRIFLCCQQDLRPHPLPAYRFWAEYFRQALTETGHVCLEAPGCDWAEGLLPLDPSALAAWRIRTWRQAGQWIREEHARQPIDIFIGYLFPGQVLPSALAEIRSLGIPCVNFFCDNVREFRKIPAEFHSFDLHWVPEFKALPLYRHAALPVLHAPMPCWVPPRWRTAVPANEETFPPGFVGTRDAQREQLFGAAFALGLTLDLRGTGWFEPAPAPTQLSSRGGLSARLGRQADFIRSQGWTAFVRKCLPEFDPRPMCNPSFAAHTRPSPTGNDYWRVIRGSKICVGVNRYPSLRFPFDRPDTYSRLRDIEAPMAGACYLTEWTEGLDELYDLGTEIETYRTATELAGKVAELAADPRRRDRLRAAGQRRALTHHSIARTIERIANRLDLR